jgi:hypothetical protein
MKNITTVVDTKSPTPKQNNTKRTSEGKDLQTIQMFHRTEAEDQMQGPRVHMEHDIHRLDSYHKKPT